MCSRKPASTFQREDIMEDSGGFVLLAKKAFKEK
jgi:hypothetical protein